MAQVQELVGDVEALEGCHAPEAGGEGREARRRQLEPPKRQGRKRGEGYSNNWSGQS